jgi:methylthioribulose-1-phosphate dehydratase
MSLLVDPPRHTSANSHPAHEASLPYLGERQALQAIGRQFHARGWSLATSSNYSCVVGRNPLRLLITASGQHKGELTLDDYVLVDAAGENVEPRSGKPSAETLLHCVLAERIPGVGAVLHTHSVWGTVLGDVACRQGMLEVQGYEMQKGLAGVASHEERVELRVFENTQDIAALARQLAQELETGGAGLRHGFLLRRHGLYTWGANLMDARRHVEALEFLFEVQGRTGEVQGRTGEVQRHRGELSGAPRE